MKKDFWEEEWYYEWGKAEIDPNRIELRLVLPAKMIPNNMRVTKEKGTVRFLHSTEINVIPYSKNSSSELLPVTLEGHFLIDGSSNITQITPDTKLCWIADIDTFVKYQTDYIEGIPS